MMTYVTAFIFYTLAMVGILLVGFIVYKKTFMVNNSQNKGSIQVLDSLPIGNKKTLLVVKVRNERFLIASGAEHTTFLSKLDNTQNNTQEIKNQEVEKLLNRQQQNILNKQQQNIFSTQQVQNNQMYYKNNEEGKIQELQRQFQELYDKDENMSQLSQDNSSKKAMLKQLLREINLEKNLNSGSRF